MIAELVIAGLEAFTIGVIMVLIVRRRLNKLARARKENELKGEGGHGSSSKSP